jgi:dolichyl-phosphate-mannose-protein mannosyltransferase
MTPSDPTLRRELATVFALTVLGGVLRVFMLGRLGLEHFDEGIYALSGLWIVTPGGPAVFNSSLVPYAPPGFTALIGLAYFTLGVSDLAAISVSLACGIVTVPLAGWLGRRTFGPGAGTAAAAFAALCGPHVAFSRMALTDVPFLLSWQVSLGLGARFLEKPRMGRALLFGLAVGLAQNLKYNGWLAGVIVGLVPLLDLLTGRLRGRVQIERVFGLGLVAALLSAFLYLPWFNFVESHGGYAALLAHHRSYMGGFSTWLPHLKLQLDQDVALSGGPVWLVSAWALAWLGSAFVAHSWRLRAPVGPGQKHPRFRLVLLCGLAALPALPTLLWWVGVGWFAWLIRSGRPSVRLLAVWWVTLSLATPFYHPYARLWLPLHAAGWLLMGGLVKNLCDASNHGTTATEWRSAGRRVPTIVAVLVLSLATWQRFGTAVPARPLFYVPETSDSLREIVGRHANSALPRSAPSALHLLARPPALFYCATGGSRSPYQNHPDFNALNRAARPRDMVVLDEVLLRQEPPRSAGQTVLFRLLRRSAHFAELDRLNGPTLLDVDPGSAYGRSDLGQVPDHSSAAPFQDTNPAARIWVLSGWQLKKLTAP